MIANLRKRLHHLRHNQDGFSLPEVVVSVIINGIVLTIIATGVMTFLALQVNISGTSKANTEVILAETAWRADVGEATSISVTNSTAASFTAPNSDGSCRVTSWQIAAGTPAKKLVRSIINYPTTNANTAVCEGTPTPALVQTLIPNVSNNAVFSFKNIAGRGVTFTGGVGTAAAASAPAGVSTSVWNETSVGTAIIQLNASVDLGFPTPAYISQLAVSVLRAAPPATTTGTPDAGARNATQ